MREFANRSHYTITQRINLSRSLFGRLMQLSSTEMYSNISEPIAKKMVGEDFKDRINVER